MARRRQTFQPISWFWDIYKRGLLNMDPSYQRRSVWNNSYREQFIDTILLDYPTPAIFLFPRISESGETRFELVDGKQRLTTVFDFIRNRFPVGEKSPLTSLRGRFFDSLTTEGKIAFYEYDFTVEYLPTNNELLIDDVFSRLNRNIAKLSFQELRHARFGGVFISRAEELADWMESRFERPFPRLTEQARRQMKDVEIVASLLLFLENGPMGYSVLELDQEFADRDQEWERGSEVVAEFRSVIDYLADLIRHADGAFLAQSRFRNQADFYSLFGAIAELRRESALPADLSVVGNRLLGFLKALEDTEDGQPKSKRLAEYYNAARSASNDLTPRKTRISVIKDVLSGVEVASEQ